MGVASKSKDASLLVYNGRTHYNEWQFVYIAQTQAPGAPTEVLGAFVTDSSAGVKAKLKVTPEVAAFVFVVVVVAAHVTVAVMLVIVIARLDN